MARMVATKAALSIRLDALADVDTKSGPTAPTIGVENRAKLESRLRALEYGSELNGSRNGIGADSSLRKKQSKYELTGSAQTYNTAADSVNLIPTGRNPVEAAVNAVIEVKEDQKKSKKERKEKEEKSKGKSVAMDVDVESVRPSLHRALGFCLTFSIKTIVFCQRDRNRSRTQGSEASQEGQEEKGR